MADVPHLEQKAYDTVIGNADTNSKSKLAEVHPMSEAEDGVDHTWLGLHHQSAANRNSSVKVKGSHQVRIYWYSRVMCSMPPHLHH